MSFHDLIVSVIFGGRWRGYRATCILTPYMHVCIYIATQVIGSDVVSRASPFPFCGRGLACETSSDDS